MNVLDVQTKKVNKLPNAVRPLNSEEKVVEELSNLFKVYHYKFPLCNGMTLRFDLVWDSGYEASIENIDIEVEDKKVTLPCVKIFNKRIKKVIEAINNLAKKNKKNKYDYFHELEALADDCNKPRRNS